MTDKQKLPELTEFFEELDVPVYGSSHERIERIYRLTIQKSGLRAIHRPPNKKLLFLAAVLAVILLSSLLAGAGYVYSRYFGSMYREDPIFEKMMAEADNGEAMPSAPIDGGLEKLTETSWEELSNLLDSMAPGTIRYGAAETNGDWSTVSAIRSDHFGLFRSSSGMIGSWTYWESPAPQEFLDILTASGTITMELDSSRYTLKQLSFEPTHMINYLLMDYEDLEGNEIQVSLTYGIGVLRPFEEVSARDVTVGGKLFTLVERDGIPTLDYYLGGYHRVQLSGPLTGNGKLLLAAAEHLTIHNAGAVQPKPYAESIGSFPDPQLYQYADEIDAALQKAENAGQDRDPAWTRGNTSITLNMGEGNFFVSYMGEDFSSNLLQYAPVSVAPPFGQEAWFPAELFVNHTIYYHGNRVDSMSWDVNGDEYYKLQYYNVFREPAVSTPMDALVQFLRHENHQPYEKQERGGTLYLLCHPLNGVDPEKTVVVYCAVLEEDEYHIYRLFMPKSRLD